MVFFLRKKSTTEILIHPIMINLTYLLSRGVTTFHEGISFPARLLIAPDDLCQYHNQLISSTVFRFLTSLIGTSIAFRITIDWTSHLLSKEITDEKKSWTVRG